MAYMNKGCVPGGPYPNKAGEYCGNHRATEACPNSMRVGRPRPCKAGTTAEMEAQGYVGLYLKEDQKLMSWEVECETPPELTEPVASTDSAIRQQGVQMDLAERDRQEEDRAEIAATGYCRSDVIEPEASTGETDGA